MSSYSIFTYQFQRILKGAQMTLDFSDQPSVACTDEDWVRRQQLFGSLFEDKYTFKAKIRPLSDFIGIK